MIEELGTAEVEELLRAQVVCRLGCHADGLTYVVPVIYAFARDEDGDAVYVATVEGQKVRMMRANPRVCVEVDEYERGSWRSVIAHGTYEELEGAGAERALAILAERFARGGDGTGTRRRPVAGDRRTVCFRIRLESATGRAVSR